MRRKTLKKNKLWSPKRLGSPKSERLWPLKYYRGLTRKQALERKAEIKKFSKMHWSDPKAYVGFKTDKYAKTRRKSSYTAQWDRMFPDAKSIKERAKVTGVPEKYLQQVYNRGMAAWAVSGHRPAVSQAAWSWPRISSVLLCGKSHYTADSDIVRKAKKESASARKWFKRCKTSRLTRI
jgi:hypothetical protein